MTSVDQFTIDTPEQTQLDFPLAGIGSRFLALALDTLIQTAVMIALFFVTMVLAALGADLLLGSSQWVVALFLLAYFLCFFGYFAIFESVWNGQTPGKRVMKLRVIKDSGRPITVYEAVTRNLLRLVDQLPFLYGFGILCAFFSKQYKRLGDHVAGTVVVHERPLEQPLAMQDSAARLASEPSSGGSRITLEELQLIEAFLQRRDTMEFDLRRQMALQISYRIATRLNVPPEHRGNPEKFLENLAAERRSSARLSL